MSIFIQGECARCGVLVRGTLDDRLFANLFLTIPGRGAFRETIFKATLICKNVQLCAERQGKGTEVSQVKWCDIGQHAFPAGQPGSTTMKLEQQVKNQWGGYQPSDIVQDICAACATDSGIVDYRTEQSDEQLAALAQEQRARSGGRILSKVQAITNGKGSGSVTDPEEARQRGYDPDYVAWLEEKTQEPLPDADEVAASVTRHPSAPRPRPVH